MNKTLEQLKADAADANADVYDAAAYAAVAADIAADARAAVYAAAAYADAAAAAVAAYNGETE